MWVTSRNSLPIILGQGVPPVSLLLLLVDVVNQLPKGVLPNAKSIILVFYYFVKSNAAMRNHITKFRFYYNLHATTLLPLVACPFF